MSQTSWKCSWLSSCFQSGKCLEYNAYLLLSQCLYFIIYGLISFPHRNILEHVLVPPPRNTENWRNHSKKEVLYQHELWGNQSGRVICGASIMFSLSAVLGMIQVLSKVMMFSMCSVAQDEIISITVFSLPLFVFIDLCATLNRIQHTQTLFNRFLWHVYLWELL